MSNIMNSDDDSEDETFGAQSPPLTEQIASILRRYPDGGQILKELIQNADDAGATEVRFLVDPRQHPKEGLPNEHFKKYQGPALYAWNDATFQRNDWDCLAKIERSEKEKEVLKVGRFGLGFLSVFHVTDLPMIVSRKWVGIVDPHRECVCVKDETQPAGEKKRLGEFFKHKGHVACFDGIFGMSSEQTDYNATLFRFPLRQPDTESKISSTTYNPEKVIDNLFSSLKEEAPLILLFLKNVTSISVYRWDGKPTLMFGVKVDAASKQALQTERKQSKILAENYRLTSSRAEVQLFTATFLQTLAEREEKKIHWLVLSVIGSDNMALKKCGDELKVLPWVAIAANLPEHIHLPQGCSFSASAITEPNILLHELSPFLDQLHRSRLTLPLSKEDAGSVSGQAFCFLPLPGCTALPVNVHGYFSVADNRRSIKWPAHDDKGKEARWNYELLHNLIAPAYSILLACRSSLLQYQGTQPAQNTRHITDPYAAWPVYREVKNQTIWSHLVEPTLKLASEFPLIWTQADEGKWVKLSDAYFLPGSFSSAPTILPPALAIEALIYAGIPVVSFPHALCETIQSYKTLLEVVVGHEITPPLVRKALRKHKEFLQSRSIMTDHHSMLALLEYILSDSDLGTFSEKDLVGIPLLPLKSDKLPFCQFEHSLQANSKYIFTSTLKEVLQLLPGVDSMIVSTDISPDLEKKLVMLANHGQLQLKLATHENICSTILKQSVFSWIKQQKGPSVWNWTPGCSNHPTLEWIRGIWNWLTSTSVPLPLLEGLPLIPQFLPQDSLHTEVTISLIEIKKTISLTVIPFYQPAMLVGILEQLGFTIVERSVCFAHSMMDRYIPILSPALVAQQIYSHKKANTVYSFSNEQKDALREYLASGSIPLQYHQCLSSLPIFKAGIGKSEVEYVPLDPRRHILPPAQLTLPTNFCYPDYILSREDYSSIQLIKTLGWIPELSVEEFCVEHLIPYVCSLQQSDRDDIAKWLLSQQPYLPRPVISCLKKSKFIHSLSYLKSPSELYDPHSQTFQELFDSKTDPVFPAEQYGPYLGNLRQLGLITWNSVSRNVDQLGSLIQSRVQTVAVLSKDDVQAALQRSKTILKILMQCFPDRLWNVVRHVPFLFAQSTPPPFYPSHLPWYGQSMHRLETAENLCLPVHQNELLVGSVKPFLSGEYESIRGDLTTRRFSQIHAADVTQQLCNLVTAVKAEKVVDYRSISQMVSSIYRFLSTVQFPEQSLPSCWIWWESVKEFLPVARVVLKLPHGIDLEPYIFSISKNLHLSQFKSLFKQCKTKKSIEAAGAVQILHKIQSICKSSARSLSNSELKMVLDILKWLKETSESPGNILIPTSNGFLLPSIQCTFDDRDWIKQKKNLLQISHFTFVHENVDAPLAKYFQVKPLSEKIAPSEKLCIKYTLAGQHERVTRRIHHIVQDYETNIDIFKELIQNADDAGATEVKFLIDWRKHPSSSLFSGELQPWQGPALIAYNNATFSDQDFQHICQLAGETKQSDPLKTGRFGVGFCAVYQLTDLPSFISRRYFTMFDPHTIYLGDRVSQREPGMRIDLVESQRDLKVYEDQFVPYQNIFDCNIFDLPEEGYNGTLFRFPFRNKVTASNSEICRKIYTIRELERLEKALHNRATELLLFLKHVERVSLFHLDEDARSHSDMKQVLSVQKSACQIVHIADLDCYKSNARTSLIQDYLHNPSYQGTKKSSFKIEVSTKTSGCSQSQWLLCSTLQSPSSTPDLKLEGKQTGLVPFAEVSVNIDMVSGELIPKNVEGLTFCFLPLPVKSGLQFHINGFFDVGKDRRSLSAADDETFGSRWNKALGQSALTEAFNQLLATLASRTNLKEIKDPKAKKDILKLYYSLWNLKNSNGIVPQALASSFKKQLMDTDLKIVWSEVNGGCWICPKEAIIFFDYLKGEVCMDAIKMMIQEGYRIVESPDDVMVRIKNGLQEKKLKAVYDYQRFCEEVLFPNIHTVDPSLREKHLLFLLEKVAQDDYNYKYKWANNLLQENHCIPCQESGELLPPDRLIDCTQPHLKCLYSPSEGRFPSDCLLKSKRAMDGLTLLGMARYKLKLPDLHERATSVCKLVPHEATERSHHILAYFHKIYCFNTFIFTITDEMKQVRETLWNVAFLLPLKKPEGIDIPWYTNPGYITPSESIHPKYKNLTSTQKPVVELPPTLTNGYQVLNCLGVGRNVPTLELVLQQLQCLVSSLTEVRISDATRSYLNNEEVMCDIYNYLEQKLKNDSEGAVAEFLKERLQGLSFIWQDRYFLSVNQVVKSWHHQWYPYMCELSPTNKQFEKLFSILGVQEEATVEVLAQILKKIKDNHDSETPVSDDIIPFIEYILRNLELQLKLGKKCSKDIYLPDENRVMRLASQLASQKIDSAGWLTESEAYRDHFETGSGHFVHPSISIERAETLGARPLLAAILKDIEDENFLDGIDYGQHEELHDRLNSILKKYPADESIFQEFIQNADDAQASEIVFVLDHRTDFQEKKLFGDGRNWVKLQHTPALCIFNNRRFSEADIQGLAKLGRGGKDRSGDKIGKFGIGFNVAYHITDCPTFLSYGEGGLPENFCVLDPTCEFAPKASNKRSPGRRWKVTSKHIEEFADQFEPFLANDLPELSRCAPNCLRNISENGFVVFRLPLTRKPENLCSHYPYAQTVPRHKNKLEGKIFSIEDLSELLKSLSSKAKDILVYLNHVQQISVFEIKEGGRYTHHSTTTATIPTLHLQAYKQFASYTSDCLQQIREGKCPATKSTCHEVNILHVEKQDRENGELTTWLVQRAVGSDQLSLGLLQSAIEHGLKPLGGVAAQLNLENRQYHIFCFLPLPLNSHLPVHVNGHFLVDDSRKHFETIKHEGLSEWNKEIATNVIAHAYVDLVLQAMDMVPLTVNSKWFYNLFPKLEISGELGDLKLPEAFYTQLLSKNPPILVPQQSPLVHGTANPQVQLPWFQLKSAYFCTKLNCEETGKVAVVSPELREALVALGMPLTSAPQLIYKSCSKIDERYEKLARIDPHKVIKHLQQMKVCDSTEVLLRQNVEHLLKYCSRGYTENEFPSVLQTVPLLLASDGSLQKSSHIYESKFTALLPGLAKSFIDPNLERSEVGKYLLQCKVIVPLPIKVVAHHIELPDTKFPIPVSSEPNSMQILTNLWEYLSEYSRTWSSDIVLHYFHCKAIIPTMDERLFPVSLCKAVINTVIGDSDVQNVLTKLGCPLLDCGRQKAVQVFRNVITQCSSPEDVIECLRLQPTLNCKVELNAEEVRAFIECIRKSKSIKKLEVTRILSRLRLFQTTDGSFVSLDSARPGIFVVPPKIPLNGIDEIQKHTNTVILKRPDKYTQMFYSAVVPRYSEAVISLSDFYVRLIVPNIELLGNAAIIKQLQFIKQAHEQSDPDMQCVIDALRKVRFICLNGSYRLVSDLYDPEVEFFKTFYPTELPPDPWNSQKWLPFLRDVGLKTKIADSDWLSQAKLLASSCHPPRVIREQSQVLLESLIEKIKASSKVEQGPVEVHVITVFLQVVANIHFICPSMSLHLNELLTSISPPLLTQQFKQNSLICFRDSVFLADADLAGLHKSVLPKECDELRSSKMRKDGLQIEFPLTTKTVAQNLFLLSERVSTSCTQQQKSTSVIKEMVKLFNAHYAFLNMKKKLTYMDLEPLMNKAFLLLNTEDSPASSPITLVKRTQLAKYIPAGCSLEPFCYRMPPHLLKYDHFIKALHICEELKAFQYADILNSINDGIRQSGMELKSDYQYRKVAEGAYNQLICCLRCGDNTITGRINVFLLTDQCELQHSSELYYDDVPWYAKRIPTQSRADFKFIKRPSPDDRGRTIPPVTLGVKLLSTVISEKLHEDVKSSDFKCLEEDLYELKKRRTRCDYVQKLLDTLSSNELLSGLCRVYWSENKTVPTQNFLNAAKILAHVEIKCIAHEPLKTVLCQNDRLIPGTEEKAFCHMEMENGKHVLYISPHIDDFSIDSFLKQLAFAVRKVLHGEIKNDSPIVAMFLHNPQCIQQVLDDERVEPYNPNELEKVTYHDVGDTVQLDTLTHHDLLIILSFTAGELVLFHSTDGIMRYCEIVEVKQPHKVFEPSVQIRTQVTNSNDDAEDTEEEDKMWVTPLQLYKCLTPHQRAALFSKQPVASTFATPIILAEVPFNDSDSLHAWLRELYHSLEIQRFSGLDISLLAIRLVGHLHYQLVIQDRARHLFGPAAMEIQRLTCYTELPCCTVDDHHQLVKTLDKLAGRFERMSLEEGGEEEEVTRSFRIQLAGRMCLEEAAESEAVIRYSSTSDSDDDTEQLSNPYCRSHPLRSQQTPSPRSCQIHQTPPSPVAQPTPHQYPQPRFPTMSRRRGYRLPQPSRFPPFQQTSTQPQQPPKPPINMNSSRMWLEQAKADYRAAEFLLESMGEVDSMEVEVQQEQSAGTHHFPALVCFLCHETVEKCLKGVHYAFCGLRPNLIDSSHLVELLESLKQSPHSPKALIPSLGDCVYLINEHENKSRLPNYQIPPCAPAAVYNHMDAIEAFSATRKLLTELQENEKLKDLFGCIGEIPKPRFVSTLKSMATAEEYPETWDPMRDTDELLLVLLDAELESEEYDRIAGRFLQTMPHSEILRIERIQNKPLWTKYLQCSQHMLEFNDAILGEQVLFHGSRTTDPKEIYSGDSSFDMRFSADGMWGKGNYFAVNASYSDGYAYRSKTGLKKMLVAWVLTGVSYHCVPQRYTKPPLRGAQGRGGIQRRYDSVSGVTGGSKVFITYENNHAYPAYLITYR